MSPVATFNQGLKIAVETDRSTAPSSTPTVSGGNKAPWWGGGRWFDVITNGVPNIEDRQAVIFPAGHAGKRPLNQQAPVVGRAWSEGDLAAPIVGDYLGALLYASLGGISSNMVPSAGPSLLNNEVINVNPKSFVLAVQPDDGGNILRFDVKQTGAGFTAGTISICGIDAYGNGASELISLASPGLHWSRVSWSAIGASSIAVSGISAASFTIFGVRRYEHTFFSASSAPTLAIERVGAPTAGNPASKSHMHVGMSLKELGLATPAADDEGIFNLTSSFEGDPTATCNAPSLNAASPLRIWPAWTLRITRDGGTNWYVPTAFDMTINSGNRNYKAAAGAQNPQGKFAGPQEISGRANILLDNEFEFNRWRGASRTTLYARWLTDWRLNAVSSRNYELSASLPVYFQAAEVGEDENAFTLAIDWRTVSDANWDIGQFLLVNGIPGQAYGGNSVV